MKRSITQRLLEWKNSSYRKPLILQGPRQVGKTYIINEFGRDHYHNVAYFNFEADKRISDYFTHVLSPNKLIERLEFHSGQAIVPGSTLIIFDEVQSSNEALTSLKYFNEQANDYHIIATGSLLGIAVNRNHYSFPVGKVDFLRMYPMDFHEFLLAMNQEVLIKAIQEGFKTMTHLDLGTHEKALEFYRAYLLVGGMPAAVKAYVETKDYNIVRNEQNAIQVAYLSDMAKYSTASDIRKTRMIYNHLSTQLSRANKKFQYSQLKQGGRAKEFEGALEWLELSGLVNICRRLKDPMIPARNYLDPSSFKTYASDCGLLCQQYQVRPDLILYDSDLIVDFKGGLVENYVYNQLIANEMQSYYWESERIAEIDFIIDNHDRLIPLEVKSSENVKSRSLTLYTSKYNPVISVRVSTKHFGQESNHLSIPVYAVFCIDKPWVDQYMRPTTQK